MHESFTLSDASLLPQLCRDVEPFDRQLTEWKAAGYARVPYIFTPAIERVARDPAIVELVAALLGTDAWVVWGPNIRRATPNAAFEWHVDLESALWPSVTVMIGLSGCSETAATWCLPGTHLLAPSPGACGDAADTDRVRRYARRLLPHDCTPEQFAGFADGRFYAFDARTWHRGDPVGSVNRLALFLHYQRADAPRVPFMLDYTRHRWGREAAPFIAGPGAEPVRRVARIPLRERVRSVRARWRP